MFSAFIRKARSVASLVSLLFSVFVRVKLVPPSHDLRLPLELDLDCGVHDRFFAESFEGGAEVVGGWGEGFDLG